MRQHLLVLLACVFVAMIGVGITIPVLPFYVERLALRAGTSKQSVVMHVTLLTAVYAFMQLFFAPVWGRLSDRFGRRPLILVGIAGYVIAQILFGLATSLWLLYAARILGGVLSSATLPVSAAYVADLTDDKERARGMAWLVAPLGLALFEATFALYAREKLNYGLGAISAVFVVCGIVMTVFQIGAVSMFSGRIREMYQIIVGFALMGTSFAFLALARDAVTVWILVGVLALGTSLIAPNLASAISKRSGTHRVGAALGVQNAASSFGQAGGTVLGGALFVWNINAPYLIAGALMLTVAIVLGWKSMTARDAHH